MERIIFHIDVNSAFLSWTAVNEIAKGATLDLREIPSIIGGDQQSRHGVVLAKSIPAKKFHIKTGEPVAHALKKCPWLMMRQPDHKLYNKHSRQLMQYLNSITPEIEKVSVDECYFDFTSIAHRYSSPVEAATLIKNEIYDRFGYSVNIGISVNKLLAKMASDFQKPNLVHTLFPHELPEKMWPLPVGKLYMAGKSSVESMNKLAIYTIGDLARSDARLLSYHLKSHGQMLHNFANGIDDSPLISEPMDAKCVGSSTTLPKDFVDKEEIRLTLLSLCESVAKRLREAKFAAGNICVEVKYNTFQKVSHQMQLQTPANAADILYPYACRLFDQLWDGSPIRLLGIRTAKLSSESDPIQLSLFDLDMGQLKKHQNLEKALDNIRDKFGEDAIKRGSML